MFSGAKSVLDLGFISCSHPPKNPLKSVSKRRRNLEENGMNPHHMHVGHSDLLLPVEATGLSGRISCLRWPRGKLLLPSSLSAVVFNSSCLRDD